MKNEPWNPTPLTVGSIIVAAMLGLSGCATVGEVEREETLRRMSDNSLSSKVLLVEDHANQLERRIERLERSEKIDREFAAMAEEPSYFDVLARDAACETDRALAYDPKTPDDIRKLLYKSLTGCRTKKQGAALDRMAKRMPGKPLPKPSLLPPEPEKCDPWDPQCLSRSGVLK